MTWVLVIMMLGTGKAVTTIDMYSEKICQTAIDKLTEASPSTTYICIKRK